MYTKYLSRCYNRAYKMSLLSFNVVSYFVNCFKMNSLLIILGISLSIIYCKAVILDYSNITPWRIAYAIYPVYEPESWVDVWKNERSPESWVQVWKNERSWDVFDNAILNVKINDHQKSDNKLNRETADVSNHHQNSQPPIKSENNKNLKSETSPTYSWPRNDKDWPKSVKKDHSSI